MDELEYSDNLMPSDAGSSMFTQEADREIERIIGQEQAMMTGAAPLLDLLFDWYDGEIERAATIKGINLESKVSAEAQILAKQQLSDFLIASKARLEILRDQHVG